MPSKTRERYVWMGITVFLLTAVVLVAFSPRVVAGNREEEKEELLAAFEIILDIVQENYIDADKVQTRDLMLRMLPVCSSAECRFQIHPGNFCVFCAIQAYLPTRRSFIKDGTSLS